MRLARHANRDSAFVLSLLHLTEEDRTWLIDNGWEEPNHATFVRINGLTEETLPTVFSRI